MEFWGVEVKAGETLKVSGNSHLLCISQISLGDAKKDKSNEYVVLYLNVDGKKLVLGTLCPGKLPQITINLVFDRDFELSHNWKHGSVYFTGYRVPNEDGSSEDNSDTDSEDELVPAAFNHGKRETQNAQVKPGSSEGKRVKIVEPKKDEEDDDSSDESDDDSSDNSSDDQNVANGGQDDTESDEDDEDTDDEDDEDTDDEDDESDDKTKKIPEKPDLKKKRVAESSIKTLVPIKKAKLVTPQKTEGKSSGGRVATPHPFKHASKASASTSKMEQTAKSFICKPCNRSFGSDNALQSHNKAKHSS